MVTSPNGTRFDVEVKGVGSLAAIGSGRRSRRATTCIVLAVVARGAPNRFFVMTQKEINDAIAELRAGAEAGRYKAIDGIERYVAKPHEDKWTEKLPA